MIWVNKLSKASVITSGGAPGLEPIPLKLLPARDCLSAICKESINRPVAIIGDNGSGTRFQPAFDWIAESGFGADAIVYATDLHCSDQPQDPGVPVIWLTPTRNRTMPFGEIVPVNV